MSDSERLEKAIDDAFSKLKSGSGKVRDDYYGLMYFEHVLNIPRDTALDLVSFGNHDLGVDGVYLDGDQESFRIFQFKNSKSIAQFGDSLVRLIDHGIPALFGGIESTPDHQSILVNARKVIDDNKDAMQQVFVDFIFRGNPQDAEQSSVISELAERLSQDRSWMLEKYFGDRVPLKVRFYSFDGISNKAVHDHFKLRLSGVSEITGPNGMRMCVGFVPITDLLAINFILRRAFLERNIRFALPPDSHVNRSLYRTFHLMLLKRTLTPNLFAFHHNGVTISAGGTRYWGTWRSGYLCSAPVKWGADYFDFCRFLGAKRSRSKSEWW